ncbi:MAG: acylphosphatase [Candidatus Thermoplasmatota archaeon]|nr:acylphosphatase [Candidatus Thermoplasmatota archaeon]
MKSKVQVIISGRVQGVWFRANTKNKAEQLGITGWVRNTNNGKVEALFEGEDEVLEKMLKWCNHGPPMAEVTDVKVKRNPDTDEHDSFSIKY